MAVTFPLTIETKSGYKAEVTNPSSGCYHFNVLKPTGEPDFDYSEKDTTGASSNNSRTPVQFELLHAFWEKQR